MRHLKLNEHDWMQLKDYSKIFAVEIRKKLPAEWSITIEDIEGSIFDTFIYLLGNYRDGALSPVSYCYQFGLLKTYNRLMAEYNKHKYTRTDIEPYESMENNLELRDDVKNIIDKASHQDKEIMKMVFEGYSFDEIAKKFNTNKMNITRRLKKYRDEISEKISTKIPV